MIIQVNCLENRRVSCLEELSTLTAHNFQSILSITWQPVFVIARFFQPTGESGKKNSGNPHVHYSKFLRF